MSENVHDEFCFNTDLYQDDVEGYMCICNRLNDARHQAVQDVKNAPALHGLIAESDHVAAVNDAQKHAKELHQIVLMLLDQHHGSVVIDHAEQEAHNPNRVVSWWRDERRFLHIVIQEGE